MPLGGFHSRNYSTDFVYVSYWGLYTESCLADYILILTLHEVQAEFYHFLKKQSLLLQNIDIWHKISFAAFL